ncbi:MAG: hypothetical protein DRO90_02115 [Candidatus Altiarchaeales archaeon]|nr:MAG: hypothetical protein DRO95_05875 [Candidatus Altiarchaeales archaeon]RLI93670.1 MAG: hypothetical protein DRO94_04630 [Candidatus Altiarchaeales archaeon]RLI94410.1 MAG: hypothetical protein DRO90_02115 [Candidatus Altiarchaeales archaeon]HDO81970.1 hypothetical protein [Candidatus Altiarchaeales archaeon]HEX54619.1 hypothetical protein [Candidatus Altiarchaeales archaeon]
MAVRRFKCYNCNHEFEVPYGTGVRGRDMKCPKCGSNNIHRLDAGPRGMGMGRGPSPQGRGRGGPGRGPRFLD